MLGTDLYEAPDDVTIDLNDKISGPFLLEKISVRFDFSSRFESDDRLTIRQELTRNSDQTELPGNLGFEWINTEDGTASGNSYSISAKTITAFLLRQSAEKKGVYNYNTNIKSGYGSVKHSRTVSGSFRDVIGYGQSVMIQEANNFNSNTSKYLKALDPNGSEVILNKEALVKHGLKREQLIVFPNIGDDAAADTSNEFSSTAEINFVPKNIFASPQRGLIQITTPIIGAATSQTYMSLEWQPDRSFLYDDRELVEERRYTNGVNGTIPDTKLPTTTIATGQGTGNVRSTFTSPPLNHEDYDKSAPYILYPEDELILGIQGPIANQWASNNQIKANYIKIHPSKIQLTLYGSFLNQDKPTAVSHAQNLNTNVVYTAIGEITTKDSFNTSQRLQYAGSWSDDVISGSSDPSNQYYGWMDQSQGNPTPGATETFLARRVGGRSSQGTQGEKGALKIYNRLVDKKERDYDSIMPSFIDMAIADTKEYSLGPGYLDKLKVGNIQLGNFVDLAEFNHAWPYSFPFEKRFANISRVDQFIDNSGNSIDRLRINIKDTAHDESFFLYTNAGVATGVKTSIVPRNFGTFGTSIANAVLETDIYMTVAESSRILFGIGDLNRGRYFVQSSTTENPVGIAFSGGFKYGISNTSPNYSQAIYSRKSYGQFRDLIEMRNLAANTIDSVTTFAVEQKFFTRAGQPLSKELRYQTSCSNISTYASSSIPFFDRNNGAVSTNADLIAKGPSDISPNFAVGRGPFIRKSGF